MATMTSFEDRMSALRLHLTIDKPDAPKYFTHIYADFVELNALFLKEQVTLSDISDLLNDVKDANIIEPDDSLPQMSKPERNDIIEQRIRDIFYVCVERAGIYSASEYPFELTNKTIILKTSLTERHKLYLMLLLSSNLNYFKSFNDVLTKEFELLSFHSLRSYLSPKAIVKSFGKNTDYTGNTINKIKTLAKELGIRVNSDNVGCISKKNVQERGCDLISWLPFDDRIPNMIVLLCQCACGKEWEGKQAETKMFSNYFYFPLTPIHSMFVPYALSNSDGSFYQNDRITNNLFFDRKRIIEQFDEIDFIHTLESLQLVNEFIRTRIEVN